MSFFLILNSGSQTEKIALFKSAGKALESIYRNQASIKSNDQRESIIAKLIDESPVGTDQITAVGHRIVHGGTKFRNTVVADQKVLADLEELNELAPLHNPPALAGVRASIKLFKDAKQLLVFDTAFHHTLDEAHYRYALPAKWNQYAIRKYGFHGISHQYCAQTVAELSGKDVGQLNFISCHLGGGSSVCAIENGKSIDISMGFTPLDGVMMSTRSGAIDPAIIRYLGQKQKLSLEEMEQALNKESGLLGVSELSSDMKEILAACKENNTKAKLAHQMYCLSIAKEIAGMVTNFKRLDAIAFTGGIGFNDGETRAAIFPDGNLFNVVLANNSVGEDNRVVSQKQSKYPVFVVRADEELMIARECLRCQTGGLRS